MGSATFLRSPRDDYLSPYVPRGAFLYNPETLKCCLLTCDPPYEQLPRVIGQITWVTLAFRALYGSLEEQVPQSVEQN